MMNLTDLAEKYGSDKGTGEAANGHRYTYLYDLLFEPIRQQPLILAELGLARGGPEEGGPVERTVMSPSIQMWLEYFPHARIFGFDISDFSHMNEERFVFIRGDLGAEADLQVLADAAPAFDIIIDDASHASYHQQIAFKVLFPKLADGGLYIIEDLHWQPPFETELPTAPKTGELLARFFESSEYVPGAVLSEQFLREVSGTIQSFSLFPAFAGHPFPVKLIVLRKRRTLEGPQPSRLSFAGPAEQPKDIVDRSDTHGTGAIRYSTKIARQAAAAMESVPYNSVAFGELLEASGADMLDGIASRNVHDVPLGLREFSYSFLAALRLQPESPDLMEFALEFVADAHREGRVDDLVSVTNYIFKSISLIPPRLGPEWIAQAVRTCHMLHVEANRLIHSTLSKRTEYGAIKKELNRLIASIDYDVTGRTVTFVFLTEDYFDNLEGWLQIYAQHEIDAHLVIVAIGEGLASRVWPVVHRLGLPSISVADFVPTAPLTKCGNGTNLWFLWFMKVYVTTALLERHCTVIYSDLDAFWMRNLYPLCWEIEANVGADVCFMPATDMPKFGVLQWGFIPCAGLFFARSTRNALEFMRQWLTYTEIMFDDQIGLTQCVFDLASGWHSMDDAHIEWCAEIGMAGSSAKIAVLRPAIAHRDGSADIEHAEHCFVWHPRWEAHGDALKAMIPRLTSVAAAHSLPPSRNAALRALREIGETEL